MLRKSNPEGVNRHYQLPRRRAPGSLSGGMPRKTRSGVSRARSGVSRPAPGYPRRCDPTRQPTNTDLLRSIRRAPGGSRALLQVLGTAPEQPEPTRLRLLLPRRAHAAHCRSPQPGVRRLRAFRAARSR